MKSWSGPSWDDHNNSKTSDFVKTGGSWGERNRDDPVIADTKDSFGTRESVGWGERSVRNPRCSDGENQGDDRRSKYSNEKSKVWDGPTWDDAKDSSNASKVSGWRTKLEDPNPTAGDEKRDDDDIWGRKKNESWYKVKDSSDVTKYSNEKSKVWDTPTWDNAKDSSDASKVSEWRTKLEDSNPTAGVRDDDDIWHRQKNESWYTVKDSSDAAKYSNEKSKVSDGPTWDNVKDSSDALKVSGWPRKLEDPNLMVADEQRDYDDEWGRQKNEPWYKVKDSSDAAKSNTWGGGGGGSESSVVMKIRLDVHGHDHQIGKNIDNKWDSNLDDKMTQEIVPPKVDDTPKSFHDPIAADERGPQIESLQYQSVKQNVTLESGHVQKSRNVIMIEDFDMFNEVKGSDQNGESTSDDSGVLVISSSNGHNNVIDLNEAPSQTMNNPGIEAEVHPKETDKQAATSKQEIAASPKVDNKQEQEIASSPKVDNKQEQENIKNNNNTGKEDKTMKVFKIALVELVKEILKPKWKEGQMSRDVHKTIVKKTVDKVSSTIPGDQIPNTQDKITHYLSISKPKINKLIQAYVDRLSKTAT
jgi:hypothetical protein